MYRIDSNFIICESETIHNYGEFRSYKMITKNITMNLKFYSSHSFSISLSFSILLSLFLSIILYLFISIGLLYQFSFFFLTNSLSLSLSLSLFLSLTISVLSLSLSLSLSLFHSNNSFLYLEKFSFRNFPGNKICKATKLKIYIFIQIKNYDITSFNE